MPRHTPPGGGPSGGPPAVLFGCKVGNSAGEAEKKENVAFWLKRGTATGAAFVTKPRHFSSVTTPDLAKSGLFDPLPVEMSGSGPPLPPGRAPWLQSRRPRRGGRGGESIAIDVAVIMSEEEVGFFGVFPVEMSISGPSGTPPGPKIHLPPLQDSITATDVVVVIWAIEEAKEEAGTNVWTNSGHLADKFLAKMSGSGLFKSPVQQTRRAPLPRLTTAIGATNVMSVEVEEDEAQLT